MSKTDFQNGFALGMASGGVVEVVDTTEIDNLEDLIDDSGVLDSTEGTATEKVEQLIDKANKVDIVPYIKSARGLFARVHSFSPKAVVDFQNANDVYQAFAYWDTEPIPIVEELTVNAPSINVSNNQTCMGQTFIFNYGVKKVVLNMPDECQYMLSTFYQANKLEEVVLNFSTKNIKEFTQAFASKTLKRIIGVLDFSSATNVNWIWGSALEEVTFAPNTLSISMDMGGCGALTSGSVQSIIDGLATVTTAKTLTLKSAITLTDEQKAIINAKGWTLARW